jgi:NADH-quinone oxidoreductase subunit M
MNAFPWLTVLTLVPLLGGVIIVGMGGQQKRVRCFTLAFSLVALGITLGLWKNFNAASGELQFREQFDWVKSLGIQYHLGIDGLGLLMLLLTAIVTPLSLMACWNSEDKPHIFGALILWLQAGLFGTFTALNFFHWFLFWELALIPAFFLIKLWGGPQRGPAATQFFIYTMVGSVALLLSFLMLRLATGSFDFIELAAMARRGEITLALGNALQHAVGWKTTSYTLLGLIVFAGAFLGFAVKVPAIPFHTWLPAAYTEAPSPVTMLLTGVMSKMGVYGFLRILLPIFPEQVRLIMTPLLWLAVLTIVLSACAAFAQRDLKRMLAYSSINHLGYCLLALFAAVSIPPGVNDIGLEKAAALNGVLLQMFNHGLTAAMLFLFISLLERRSGGLRGLDDFGGIRKVVPVFTGLMGISLFSSLGLPGLNGFIGEFLIFKGVFALSPWAAAVSTIGLLVTAVFLLTLIQRVFCGPLNAKWARLPEITPTELLLVLPGTVLMFVLGLYPQLVLGVIDATVIKMVEQLKF